MCLEYKPNDQISVLATQDSRVSLQFILGKGEDLQPCAFCILLAIHLNLILSIKFLTQTQTWGEVQHIY